MMKALPYAPTEEYCPVQALLAWLDHTDIEAGPVFQPVSTTGTVLPRQPTNQSVALTGERALGPGDRLQAERAWERRSSTQQLREDRAVWIASYVSRMISRYAGHALRAGFVTSAAAAGARVGEIVDQTGQRDVRTVMRFVRV